MKDSAFLIPSIDNAKLMCIYSAISRTWYVTWSESFTELKIFCSTAVICAFGQPVEVDEDRYTDISTIREI